MKGVPTLLQYKIPTICGSNSRTMLTSCSGEHFVLEFFRCVVRLIDNIVPDDYLSLVPEAAVPKEPLQFGVVAVVWIEAQSRNASGSNM